MKSGGGRAWMKNRDILLLLTVSFSFLFFYGCLLLIPDGDRAGLLRGAASLLAIAFPTLFYLRSEAGKARDADSKRNCTLSLWRALLHVFGSFLLGVFAAELLGAYEGKITLFSQFAVESRFSLLFLVELACYVFSVMLLLYGVLVPHLAEKGAYISVFPFAFLFSAFSFSPLATPILFLFGILLAFLRLQSEIFLPGCLCAFSLAIGGYTVKAGLLCAARISFLSRPLFLLILAVFSCLCFVFAFFRGGIKQKIHRSLRWEKRPFVLWTFFSLLLLAFSLFFSLVLNNLIG